MGYPLMQLQMKSYDHMMTWNPRASKGEVCDLDIHLISGD